MLRGECIDQTEEDCSISIEGECSGHREDFFTCSGIDNYIKWNIDLPSHFKIQSEIRAASISGSDLAFVIWQGSEMLYIGMDPHVHKGGQWGDNDRYRDSLLTPGTYHDIEVSRINGRLFASVDGEEFLSSVRSIRLNGEITAVGWMPSDNTIDVRDLVLIHEIAGINSIIS